MVRAIPSASVVTDSVGLTKRLHHGPLGAGQDAHGEALPPDSMSRRVTESLSTATATSLGTVATCITQLQVIRFRLLTGPASDHEQSGGQRPEHPAPEPVVLLRLPTGGEGSDGAGRERHCQFPKGSSPASLATVVEVDGVWPVMVATRSRATVRRGTSFLRSAAERRSSGPPEAPL